MRVDTEGGIDAKGKKILFHVCCGPCFIAPYEVLKAEHNFAVTGYWFNHNIHPYQEYERRLNSLKTWSEEHAVSIIFDESYTPELFFNQINGREEERCYLCYHFRLRKVAVMAKRAHFDLFSSTLLYSRYQKHDLIKGIGMQIADQLGIEFFYRDFRSEWGRGVKLSKEVLMYRQSYCGCLYSERDRYQKRVG